MHRKPRDVEVSVTFLLSEHGGRSQGVYSGYRPQFYYNNHDWDGEYFFPDFGVDQEVPLGRAVRAYVGFISPQEHDAKLRVGSPFLVREGNRVVGFGSVTQILDLPASAERARAKDR